MDSKLIFFDIDGTLALEPSGIIPDSTRIAIAGAKKNGHRVFVNTGRTFYSISEDIRSMRLRYLYLLQGRKAAGVGNSP